MIEITNLSRIVNSGGHTGGTFNHLEHLYHVMVNDNGSFYKSYMMYFGENNTSLQPALLYALEDGRMVPYIIKNSASIDNYSMYQLAMDGLSKSAEILLTDEGLSVIPYERIRGNDIFLLDEVIVIN